MLVLLGVKCASVTSDRVLEVSGKAGEECLGSLVSPEGCDESLEVPGRHHVEVNLVVAHAEVGKQRASARDVRHPADYVTGNAKKVTGRHMEPSPVA